MDYTTIDPSQISVDVNNNIVLPTPPAPITSILFIELQSAGTVQLFVPVVVKITCVIFYAVPIHCQIFAAPSVVY